MLMLRCVTSVHKLETHHAWISTFTVGTKSRVPRKTGNSLHMRSGEPEGNVDLPAPASSFIRKGLLESRTHRQAQQAERASRAWHGIGIGAGR